MILLIAFVVVGPEDLPKVAVWLGRMVRRIRSLIRELKAESGWNEIEREINDTKREIDSDMRKLQSDMNITRELDDTSQEITSEMRKIDINLEEEK